jgi:flagellin
LTITIGANILSLRAQRRLSDATSAVGKALERLSSGRRINSSADDAAGLAISSALRSQSMVATVAVRNANYGVSAISIADSALDQVGAILTRMAELAEQSANGVYTLNQRSPLQSEFDALGSEIERIAVTTQFNGINLISSGQAIVLQVGFNSFSTSQISVQGVRGTLQSMLLANSGSSALVYSIAANSDSAAQTAARTALAGVQAAIELVASSRGNLGAAQSRLGYAINNLETARINFDTARSRIEDVDVAEEAANLVRSQILQQTATAILAQANIQPELALNLLKF